jgi:hypothetical protein
MAGVIVGVCLGLALAAVLVKLEWRFLRFLSAPAIQRRLRHSRDGRFTQRIRVLGWAWDPSPKPPGSSSAQRMSGPGVVTYVLRSDNAVEATMTRSDGSQHHSNGPFPVRLIPGTVEAKRWRKLRRLLWLAAAIYPVAGAIGFGVGYTTVSPSGNTRFQHGVFGFFAGFVAVAVVMHGLSVVIGFAGRHRHARSTS